MFPRFLKLWIVAAVAVALALAAAIIPAGASAAPSVATVTGPITVLGGSWFTVQTPGRWVGRIDALTASATRVTRMDTPYVWGGGHGEAGVPSVGIKGPGHNGHTRGFDCSGAVAAVLAGAGLWPAGAGVPADNGVITELLAEHLIARGVGRPPTSVTLYDDPGVHIFMNINGRFFGTSDGAGGGDSRGGAGWLADSAWDASDRAFRKYHFLPAVLDTKTSEGGDYTFELPPSGLFSATQGALGASLGTLTVSDLLVGERVRVSYSASPTGQMVVRSLAVISGGPVLPAPTTTPTPPPLAQSAPTSASSSPPAAGAPIVGGSPSAPTPSTGDSSSAAGTDTRSGTSSDGGAAL